MNLPNIGTRSKPARVYVTALQWEDHMRLFDALDFLLTQPGKWMLHTNDADPGKEIMITRSECYPDNYHLHFSIEDGKLHDFLVG